MKTTEGYWSGYRRLNVRYVGGIILNRVMASERVETDPKSIEFMLAGQ